jgi:hypothetical protein
MSGDMAMRVLRIKAVLLLLVYCPSNGFTMSNLLQNLICLAMPHDDLGFSLPSRLYSYCRDTTLGVSRATLFRLRRRGDFPHAVRLSTTAIGFREEDLLAWVNSRVGR